ncbi:SCO4225 family membrane protein [Streptomyces sp. NPDC001568]|uniref:SCO4225 family membrane protein n=1 Tax=Streptomyces sp. NPDC001568 TaxID=3364588 RepID=UPI003696354D
MERRWAKVEMWVPAGYLALVLGLQVWVEAVARTGDIGFGGIWPMLATAPISLLLLIPFGAPDPASLGAAPVGQPYSGAEPPPQPADFSASPVPADWAPDTSVLAEPAIWTGFGFYAVLMAGALANASLLWLMVRAVVRRRPGMPGALVQERGGRGRPQAGTTP